jgi:hypothetical protein
VVNTVAAAGLVIGALAGALRGMAGRVGRIN